MANVISILIQAKDQASPEIRRAGSAVSGMTKDVEKNGTRIGALNDRLIAYAALSGTAGVATGQLTGQITMSVDAANRYQNAMAGLNTVAGYFNQNQELAKQAAQELASDGLMTVTEAATGLKNLLASRFNLDESIQLMNRFKDSAAFNRQAALGFGQAIAGATEGIKNGNSILVDNAGVTKNLSVILQEAGYSAQDLMKATTDAGVRQALFNGILKETNPMVGDAKKLANQFAGEQARLAAETDKTQQKLGSAMQPALRDLFKTIRPVIAAVGDFAEKNPQLTSSIVMVTAGSLGFVTVLGAVGVAASAVNSGLTALGVTSLIATARTQQLTVAQVALNAVMRLNPIGLIVGASIALIAAYIGVVAQSERASTATDRLRLAREFLTRKTNEAKDAEDRLADAHLTAETASVAVERAERTYQQTVQQYGRKSLEAREAELSLRRARQDNARATDDLKNKTNAAAKANADLAAAKQNVINANDAIRDSANRAASGFQSMANAARDASKAAQSGNSGKAAQIQADQFKLKGFNGFASGTPYAPGGLTLVGERGPELVNLPRGSRVDQAYRTRQMLSEGVGGGGDTNITITGNITIESPQAADAFWNRIDQTQRLARMGMAS